MTRTLRVRLGAGLFIGAAALSLAACGPSTPTIPAGGAAQSVVDVVAKKTKFKPTDVKCPDGIDLKVGATFDCKYTGPDGAYVAHMNVAEIEGGTPIFDVKTELAK